MKVTKVIPSRVWNHIPSGSKASIYGACPWTMESDKKNWEVVQQGWTWQNSNGTVGLGRRPAATYEEALEVMDKVNGRF